MKSTKSLLLFSGLAMLAGCQSTLPQPPQCDFTRSLPFKGPVLVADNPDLISPITLNAVQIIDPAVNRKIAVHGTFSTVNSQGQVEVESRLQNCTDFPQQVEARIHFFAEDNSSAAPPSAWKWLYLSPRSIQSYNEKSLGNALSSFYIELREAG